MAYLPFRQQDSFISISEKGAVSSHNLIDKSRFRFREKMWHTIQWRVADLTEVKCLATIIPASELLTLCYERLCYKLK